MAIVLTIVFVYGCALLLLCVFCAGSFAHTTTAADAHDHRTPPRTIVFASCRGEKRTGIEYASAFLEAGLGHGFVSLPCVVSGGLSRLCNCTLTCFFRTGAWTAHWIGLATRSAATIRACASTSQRLACGGAGVAHSASERASECARRARTALQHGCAG